MEAVTVGNVCTFSYKVGELHGELRGFHDDRMKQGEANCLAFLLDVRFSHDSETVSLSSTVIFANTQACGGER